MITLSAPTNIQEMIAAMQSCEQSKGFSVYEHGESVANFLNDLVGPSTESWKLPNWFGAYKKDLFSNLHPANVIEQYLLFHDCGKPYCQQIDENGKSHFPDHANVSADIWELIGGDP